MSDNLDIASEREELARQSALLTSRKPEGPKPIGKCLYCGERLPEPMRWCDADCVAGYKDLQDYARRTGK